MTRASCQRLTTVIATMLMLAVAVSTGCGKDKDKDKDKTKASAGDKKVKRIKGKRNAEKKVAEGKEGAARPKVGGAAAMPTSATRLQLDSDKTAVAEPSADEAGPGEARPDEAKVGAAAPDPTPAGTAAAADPATANPEPAAEGDQPGAPGAAMPVDPPAAAVAAAGAVAPSAGPEAPPATAIPPPTADHAARRPAGADKAQGPPLDITGYLSAADLERVLGKKAKFRRTNLPGVAPSKGHNSLYYADAKGKEFGVSVQVWRDRNLVDSRTRYNTMRGTYSDVVETNRVTAQGFRAFYGGVVTLVFADARRPLVAAVSCSTKFCDANAVIELSRRVAGRMR